jgi:hypothetical protein
MPWIPPGSHFYQDGQRERERDKRSRGHRDRRHRNRGYRYYGYFNNNSPRYYSRHDNITWPQASVNFTWGLYGNYSRWHRNPSRSYSDSRFGVMFSYVEQNLAIKLEGIVNPTRKQVEYETLILINNYVNDNVETIAVDNDGSYFVMFKSENNGEGNWVPTDITTNDVEKAAKESSQY